MTDDDARDPRWAAAVTLRELGELIAEWLEGRLDSTPFRYAPPDPETESIAPVLARLNRMGFVTDFSQPGMIDGDEAQRAAVGGYCEDDVAERLASVSVRGDLVVISQAAGYGASYQLPITRTRNYTFTILCGDGDMAHGDDSWPAPGLNPRMREVLRATWYVGACDAVWGRRDVLWPALADALSRPADDVRGSLIDHDYIEAQIGGARATDRARRLEITPEERLVLLRDLESTLETMSEIYRERGMEWDPYADYNAGGLDLLVRTRDDLAPLDGPWSLEGTYAELEALLTRLRAGTVKGLEIGGDTGGVPGAEDLNVVNPERTDHGLDVMATCDRLLERLRLAYPEG
jgi:hypothetical protein